MINFEFSITGWGSETFRGPSTRILREVNMRVWENSDCQEIFGTLRKIFTTMMCAGGKSGEDTCQVVNYILTEFLFDSTHKKLLLIAY